MLISLFRFLQGYLKIRVTGYSPERFLNLCKNKRIEIWNLEPVQDAYEMYMKVSGFRKIKPLLKKTKTKVMIEERFGLPFFFYRYRKRTLFFGGCILCAVLIYTLSLFVWNIEFEGNQYITDEVLLEYLETKQVEHGMLKKKVNCNQIAKDIRRDFNDIIWVSVYVKGTNLYIHVKENTETFAEMQEKKASDIVADKSGKVVSMIVRSGVAMVEIGSEIQEGDVLVSGTIDVLNDAKEVVSKRYVEADADIVIQREIVYEDCVMQEYEIKSYQKKSQTFFYVKLGRYLCTVGWKKKTINFTEIHTEERQLKIGSHFYLPISFGKKKVLEYQKKTRAYSAEEMEHLLTQHFERFCRELEEKNIEILSKKWKIEEENTDMKARAVLQVLEEVGIPRKIVDLSSLPMVK